MKSLWNNKEASACGKDLLRLRVYTSRLLGKHPSLVLHGGGNTSLKARIRDFYGDWQEVLYVKGSGWDLATIEEGGFAAVKLDALRRMAALPKLSDTDMVRLQRAAMLSPDAPTPSVEAILHAIIPFAFVDHSHTDAVVAITNTPNGQARIKEIYGDKVLIVPYVMPGFILARHIFDMVQHVHWAKIEGLVLLNHGLFTFADDAKTSYEQHVRLVSKAEGYIKKQKIKIAVANPKPPDLLTLAGLRRQVSSAWGGAVVAGLKQDPRSVGFADLSNAMAIASRGTLTPDHVIRTKPTPLIIRADAAADVDAYVANYQSYFKRNTDGTLKPLDAAPRWAVWPGQGLVTFGRTIKDLRIISDIVDHTIEAIQWAQGMGGWKVLSEKDIFQMEYWELEQAKLAKSDKPLPLQGKIAIVTGALSGIGKASVEALTAQGAHVAALDIREEILKAFRSPKVLGLVCDVTSGASIIAAVAATVRSFGGLDIVVSNAGSFPPSRHLKDMDAKTWDTSLAINLTSHQRMITAAIKYLALGIDPTILIVGSKNVPAPGPGAAAYSAAKAGLTQMARVAALELGSLGIRVNVVHPNQVFDTGIWSKDILQQRAKHYQMTVQEYKTSNVLKTEITSKDVAQLICAMAGPAFSKTTGAQIPIDGGNERVI